MEFPLQSAVASESVSHGIIDWWNEEINKQKDETARECKYSNRKGNDVLPVVIVRWCVSMQWPNSSQTSFSLLEVLRKWLQHNLGRFDSQTMAA